ncbi:hypothetical protein [Bacillus thermotolerans]|uniref:hypothetical protein n=1 Tax=Bacillus thermotolerans TaxID=1221996 RepID=UPI00057F8E43|nr:hypothetical protein [Bacillus thermotolerans]KKB35220.1 hypothetical protein QY97_01961 [Bacillus thermotolerans]
MEPVAYLKDMLGIEEGTMADTAIDIGLGAAPAIGKVYQSYQMMKLQKRMNENEQQLQVLKRKIELSENEIFYKQEVFPLIVKKLMEDDEDLKAKVIFNGLEHIIDNHLKEIERIYHYYDVLSELRYSDIMIFVEKYMPYEMRRSLELNIKLPSEKEMRSERYREQQAIEKYQITKLIRLGLLEEAIVEIDGGRFTDDDKGGVKYKTKISSFGRRFLEFFSIEEFGED